HRHESVPSRARGHRAHTPSRAAVPFTLRTRKRRGEHPLRRASGRERCRSGGRAFPRTRGPGTCGARAGVHALGRRSQATRARALAAQPALLLCDEVCGGLTEAEMQAVLDLLRRIRELGTTILYVEHNLRAIMSVCDRVLVLNFGHKLAEGTPLVMQNDPAVIEAYIGLYPLRTYPSPPLPFPLSLPAPPAAS